MSEEQGTVTPSKPVLLVAGDHKPAIPIFGRAYEVLPLDALSSAIAGRDVLIWAQNSAKGYGDANATADRLLGAVVPASRVRIVQSISWPQGETLGDAIADGWDFGRLVDFAKREDGAWIHTCTYTPPTFHVEPEPVRPLTKKEQEAADREAERQARIKAALTPLKPKTMAQIVGGIYEPKIPLFEGILYPGAWLIVGRPKIGKSWLLLQLALNLAYREKFLGWDCCAEQDSEVLMICAEDDEGRIQGRINALGHATAPDNCYVISFTEFRDLAAARGNYQTFAEFIDQFLTDHPKCKLVIIDTETTTRQVWGGEAANGDDKRRITETDYMQVGEMDRIGLQHKAVIGLVNHASKRKGEWVDIHELINRSGTAMAGATGSLVLADPQGVDPLDATLKSRILGLRSRDMKDDLYLMVKQNDDLPVFENLGEYRAVMQSAVETEILEAIEEAQKEDPSGVYTSYYDIAEMIGSKQTAVKKAMSRMMKKGHAATWKNYRVDTKRGKHGGARLIAR